MHKRIPMRMAIKFLMSALLFANIIMASDIIDLKTIDGLQSINRIVHLKVDTATLVNETDLKWQYVTTVFDVNRQKADMDIQSIKPRAEKNIFIGARRRLMSIVFTGGFKTETIYTQAMPPLLASKIIVVLMLNSKSREYEIKTVWRDCDLCPRLIEETSEIQRAMR